jgi:L-alanine-DL-glutamate epimerase-like enolase superfamily enzyme
MKPDVPVESIEVSAYVIPTDGPEADGTLAWSSTTMVVAEPVAAGVRGLGWTYSDSAAAELIKGKLAGEVIGRSALDTVAAYDAMDKAVRNLGRPGLVSTAISAVDIALWDLKAKLLDLPLAKLLGAVRDRVDVYGSGGFTTYDDEQTRAQVSHWVHDLGIPRVKIKIGESWGTREERDLARVALVREAIGDDAELYVDANGGYRLRQAIRQAARMADFDVRWFEEPVSSDDLAGLRLIREQCYPDVAAGEYGYDLTYFARMLAAEAVDCLQIDVTRCGGVTEFLRAAALAAGRNLDVSAHCAPSLHASVCAAVRNYRHMEYFHDHARIEHMFFDGALTPEGGALRLDLSAPGLGLRLRYADAERYRVG